MSSGVVGTMDIGGLVRDLIDKRQDFHSYADIEAECEDAWTKDNAIVYVSLLEEDYRDYEAVFDDILKLFTHTFPRAQVRRSRKAEDPKRGTVIRVYQKSGGLSYEIEVYDVTAMRKRMVAGEKKAKKGKGS